MTKTDAAFLVPALVFGGVLGIMLLTNGISLRDALLAVCAAYGLVTLLQTVFEVSKTTSPEHKP
ncbi:MAG TPA: hypothetical protein VF898_00460 [Chloroflexota bacterium]